MVLTLVSQTDIFSKALLSYLFSYVSVAALHTWYMRIVDTVERDDIMSPVSTRNSIQSARPIVSKIITLTWTFHDGTVRSISRYTTEKSIPCLYREAEERRRKHDRTSSVSTLLQKARYLTGSECWNWNIPETKKYPVFVSRLGIVRVCLFFSIYPTIPLIKYAVAETSEHVFQLYLRRGCEAVEVGIAYQ